jgi:hypothetical protein
MSNLHFTRSTTWALKRSLFPTAIGRPQQIAFCVLRELPKRFGPGGICLGKGKSAISFRPAIRICLAGGV